MKLADIRLREERRMIGTVHVIRVCHATLMPEQSTPIHNEFAYRLTNVICGKKVHYTLNNSIAMKNKKLSIQSLVVQ